MITDPDLDYPNGMPFKYLSKSICAVFGQLWDLYFTLRPTMSKCESFF